MVFATKHLLFSLERNKIDPHLQNAVNSQWYRGDDASLQAIGFRARK